MNELELSRIIRAYFVLGGLKWPTMWQALGFAHTEIGEAYEVLLRKWDWKRNDPKKEEIRYSNVDFGEELGDAIMMLIVAGLEMGVDPVQALLQKIRSKCPDAFKT